MVNSISWSNSRANTYQRNKSFTSSRNRVGMNLGPISTIIFMLGFITVLALIYIHQVNRTNILNLKLNHLSQEYQNQEKLNQSKKVDLARMQSLEAIKASQSYAQMQQIGSVPNYLP